MHGNNMGLILLLIGGYLLYKSGYLTSSSSGSGESSDSGSSDNQASGSTVDPNTKNLMKRAAEGNAYYIQQGGLLDWHQWNYIFQQVRGISAPEPAGINPQLRLTLDEWLSVTFGGIRGITRWGHSEEIATVSEYLRSGGTTAYERARKRVI